MKRLRRRLKKEKKLPLQQGLKFLKVKEPLPKMMKVSRGVMVIPEAVNSRLFAPICQFRFVMENLLTSALTRTGADSCRSVSRSSLPAILLKVTARNFVQLVRQDTLAVVVPAALIWIPVPASSRQDVPFLFAPIYPYRFVRVKLLRWELMRMDVNACRFASARERFSQQLMGGFLLPARRENYFLF